MNGSATPACGLVVDRHVPKTAGTTVRSMLRLNVQRGACEYIGYDVGRTWESRVGFNHRSLPELALQLKSGRTESQRICMEAHMVGGTFWDELAALRASQSFMRACTLVVVIRIREPLSWYRSYYDWAVLSRQRTGDVDGGLAHWGANFSDWLPANMQSRFLLHGSKGQDSEWANVVARRRGGPTIGAERWAELESIVRSAEVVAPLDRLAESLRLVVRRSGFLRTSEFISHKPSPMHGPWERLPRLARVRPAAEFCAQPAADCAAAVRAVAPADHRLYQLANSLFEEQWRREFGSPLPPPTRFDAPPAPVVQSSSPHARRRRATKRAREEKWRAERAARTFREH